MRTPPVREMLREQYEFRCGYCGVTERDVGALLTTDHFQPRSRGGSSARDNLVYCCSACNAFKGNWWQPTDERRILHPLLDDSSPHIREQTDGTVQALTPTGAFHIRLLNLNRAPLVLHRRERYERLRLGNLESVVLSRLTALETHVSSLEDEMRQLRSR